MNNIKSTKGITLVALVITIIILLILSGITIGQLTGSGLLVKAKEAKIKSEIASIKEEIQMKIFAEQAENSGNISDDSLEEILTKYGTLSGEGKLIEKTLTTEKEKYEIKVSDIFNGTTVKDKGPVISDVSGANAPNVSKIAQKTYVTWNLNETGTEYVINDTQTTQPDNWYDYENGKWANIKTTKENEKEDGTKETLEAYWVWIPRYEYVVPTSETATQIDVKFISKSQTTPDTDKNYVIHPAFTNEGNGGFGELDGIWVAKFEASSSDHSASYGGDNVANLKVQVKPGVPSWRGIAANNMFTVCRKMTSEGEVLAGSTVDSHMMKNTEWGAVAILSQSQYGVYSPESLNGIKGDSEYQIWNNSSYTTGSVGPVLGSYESSGSVYNSAIGPKASTTGTIYGVYDMSGGAWDMTAATLKGSSNDLEYADSLFDISNQVKPDEMSNLNFARKYLDLYDYRTSKTDFSQYSIGDATIETKGWHSESSSFIYKNSPFFIRGRMGNMEW